MTEQTQIPRHFGHTMAIIANVLYYAGLTPNISSDELNEYCRWLLEEDFTFGGCDMYDYFIYGEDPRGGGVTFDVEDRSDWEFAIEYLKLMLKFNRLNLNGVTATISYYDSYATETIRFTGDVKSDMRKLDQLKKFKAGSVYVSADGEIKILAHSE